MDAEVIHELSHLFGLALGPVKVRSVKFDALIAHFGDGAHRAA